MKDIHNKQTNLWEIWNVWKVKTDLSKISESFCWKILAKDINCKTCWNSKDIFHDSIPIFFVMNLDKIDFLYMGEKLIDGDGRNEDGELS